MEDAAKVSAGKHQWIFEKVVQTSWTFSSLNILGCKYFMRRWSWELMGVQTLRPEEKQSTARFYYKGEKS